MNKKLPPTLDPKEWDFGSVRKGELETCFLYEYGRELTLQWPWLRKQLLEWKKRSEPHGRTAREINKLLRRRFGDFPWIVPEIFPAVGWQHLSREWRRELVESVTEGLPRHFRNLRNDRIRIGTLRELKPANVTSLETFALHHEILCQNESDQTEYGYFAIDWNYDESELILAFKKWLTDQRQEREKLGFPATTKRRAPRGGFRDKLRCLGALRVRNHYSPSELSNYPSEDNPNRKLKVSAPYVYLSDLYEHAKKAERLLEDVRLSNHGLQKPGKSRDSIFKKVEAIVAATK